MTKNGERKTELFCVHSLLNKRRKKTFFIASIDGRNVLVIQMFDQSYIAYHHYYQHFVQMMFYDALNVQLLPKENVN